MRIKAIDFFCGAGGLTRGLIEAGISVLAGVDNDVGLKSTYETNNKPSKFICADIRELDIDELRTQLKITNTDRVIYAACTPCQPFSTLNQMQGVDDRKELLLSFARLVEKAPPDFIIVENVPGLQTAYGREIYKEFMEVLKRKGFVHIFQSMLDAKFYGVPQSRKRFIMLASKQGPLTPPRKSRKIKTVREQIEKFPSLNPGETSEEFPNHVTRQLMPHHKLLISAVPKNGGSRGDVKDESLLLDCHKGRPKVHKDVFGRMTWDMPAPTLTCRCTDIYCGRFVHPEQDRGLSLREAAALQTFPDTYVFHGTSILHMARQIGNAVPVELARRLGNAVLLSEKKHKIK